MKKLLTHGLGYDTPEKGDEVTVHYVGTFEDGSPFDSSRDRGEPFVFKVGLGQVIKGWDQGICTMLKGEKAIFTCKSEYAYGKQGSPPKIPPDATLIFEVELFSWKSVKDITGDGGVIKKLLTEGEGYNKPGEKDEVLVEYSVTQADGRVTREMAPAEFEVYCAPCEGMKVALKTMKKGEVAKITLKPLPWPRYADNVTENSNAEVVVELKLVSWRKVESVKDTKEKVWKKILVEAEGGYNKPNSEATVTIVYEACVLNGASDPFERSPEGGLTFKTDNDEVIEGLDKAVMTMNKGEKAEITIAPEFGFGSDADVSRDLGVVSKGSTLVYTVELVELEKAKEAYSMEDAEKLDAAEAKKTDGNDLYKAGELARAKKKYDKALKFIEYDTQLGDEHKKRCKAIKLSVFSNLAAVGLKLKEYKEVIDSCNKALELDGGNVKVLFRRAQAATATEDFDIASADIKKILEKEEKNRDALVLRKALKEKMAKQREKDAKIFGNMFKKMGNLYSKDEAGKPNIVDATPESVSAMEEGDEPPEGATPLPDGQVAFEEV
eukprot:CAMPEP_0170159242 /NCGR_PEP_ID=MMETSP0033_2-20121228/70240_1 /TAXON_ID=195969 /ORGANISM="Dolichomastix tenuilepis, Strain CCMP3274" /LENGTH=550 /DNA_ID=CAMNT_0010396715 /DNA_START=15 /DNA_END=1667 /DNA_ORIENTATION=+